MSEVLDLEEELSAGITALSKAKEPPRNTEGWPTPEQVAARIAEVAALNRLCVSLADAGEQLLDAERGE